MYKNLERFFNDYYDYFVDDFQCSETDELVLTELENKIFVNSERGFTSIELSSIVKGRFAHKLFYFTITRDSSGEDPPDGEEQSVWKY